MRFLRSLACMHVCICPDPVSGHFHSPDPAPSVSRDAHHVGRWVGGWEAGVWEPELHGRAPSGHPLNEMWAWSLVSLQLFSIFIDSWYFPSSH